MYRNFIQIYHFENILQKSVKNIESVKERTISFKIKKHLQGTITETCKPYRSGQLQFFCFEDFKISIDKLYETIRLEKISTYY